MAKEYCWRSKSQLDNEGGKLKTKVDPANVDGSHETTTGTNIRQVESGMCRDDDPPMTSNVEDSDQDQVQRKSSPKSSASGLSHPNDGRIFWFHYFYGSLPAIQIYCIIVVAILLQRFWILHGITLILSKLMFERTIVWLGYLVELKEAKQGISLIKWMFYFGLRTAEGAMEGNYLKIGMTGSAIQFWKKRGQGYVFSWYKDRSKQMHDRIVKDMKKNLDEAIKARTRALEKLRRQIPASER